MIRLPKILKRRPVANSGASPVTQDDERLAAIQAERRTLQLVTREVADFKLSLIRAEEVRRLTLEHRKACADLVEAKRRHQPTAAIQARVERLNAELLAIDLEANRDAR